jgi:DNA primase
MGRLFQERRNKLPIEQIVKDTHDAEFFEDSRGELWCPCPFHNDKNPSFSINVNPTSLKYGLYHCFACGGGNVVNFVHQIKGFDSYEEAERWIEDKYLNDIDDEWNKEEFLKMVDDSEPIPVSLVEKEFPNYEISSISYDQNREGIIFPHFVAGKAVGWQIRDLTGEKKAKYLNTPDFPKSETLYHGDCECHDDSNYVIVVESPKTAAIMWGVGYRNVVATFGASINQDQMRMLWRYENVFLWFDNDEAGAKATRTALNLLKDHCEVYIVPPVSVPKGDPADVPFEEWESYLNRAQYYIHWRK